MNYQLTADDLRSWLKQNRAILKGRSSDEVAMMAHAVGFEWNVIAQVLSHFTDAMIGSSIDRRAQMGLGLELEAISQARGNASLMPQWMDLADYDEGREWEVI